MVVPNKMDPVEKDKVLNLINIKDRIEAEISEFGIVLSQNRVGMTDPLVDADGFPRNDIDILQVRQARHRIICLQNDLKEVMMRIERGLEAVHAPLLNSSAPGNLHSEVSESNVEQSDVSRPARTAPIVRINVLTPGSPADFAGLQLNDLIIEIGSVNADNFNTLNDIGQVVGSSVNKRISVVVNRNGEIKRLNLIPKPWSGTGLLGCNIIPIEDPNVER